MKMTAFLTLSHLLTPPVTGEAVVRPDAASVPLIGLVDEWVDRTGDAGNVPKLQQCRPPEFARQFMPRRYYLAVDEPQEICPEG